MLTAKKATPVMRNARRNTEGQEFWRRTGLGRWELQQDQLGREGLVREKPG